MDTATKKYKKPWYNIFSGRYTGDQPSFYDIKDLPWVPILEENWEVMRDELLALIEEEPKRLQPYSLHKKLSFPPKKWKTMGLYFWKIMIHKNCDKCPKTVAVINSIPGLISFSLSILEAESNINPHQGDTDAIYRCHIGISIPDDLPNCGFQVGKEVRSWKEGKVLPFCDAQMHKAWNNTKERRIIIILDVMRPEYIKHQNSVSARVLASFVIHMLYQRFSFLSGKSGRLKYFLYHTSRIAILGILPIQRKFKR